MNKKAVDEAAVELAKTEIRGVPSDKVLSSVTSIVTASSNGEYPDQLVHYTSLAGLRGILDARVLHATHALFMNDKAEVHYGINLCRAALEDLPTSDEDARLFRQMLLAMVTDMRQNVDMYATCFCVHDDLISQWRGYGSGTAGYAVSFNALELSVMTNVPFFRVHYEPDEQRYLVDSLLSSTFKAIRSSISSHPSERVGILGVGGTLATIGLFMFIATFKDRAFQSESEWRLIYPMPRRDQSVYSVNFRPDGNALIPYIQFPLAKSATDALPITAIRCGPSQRYEAPEVSIRYLLDQHNLKSARAERSTIPLRA